MALAKIWEFPGSDDTGLMPAFNQEILREMRAQLLRETSKCKTEADAQACARHIVASWSVRSARLYASTILEQSEARAAKASRRLSAIERLRHYSDVLALRVEAASNRQ